MSVAVHWDRADANGDDGGGGDDDDGCFVDFEVNEAPTDRARVVWTKEKSRFRCLDERRERIRQGEVS